MAVGAVSSTKPVTGTPAPRPQAPAGKAESAEPAGHVDSFALTAPSGLVTAEGGTGGVSDADRQAAQRYGLSDSTIQKLQQRPQVVEALRNIPPSIAGQFKDLSPNERSVMYKDVTGTTKILFKKIQNRDAFVNGKVLGKDVFPAMKDRIDKQVGDNEITPDEGTQLKGNLDKLKGLSTDQREAIASVIETELAPKH